MTITTNDIHTSMDALATEVQNLRVLSHDKTIDQTSYFELILGVQAEILRFTGLYLPYLRYLAKLDDIASIMAEGSLSPTLPPQHTEWPTPEAGLDHKCRVGNLIWQDLRGATNGISLSNLVTVAEENGMLAATDMVGRTFELFPLIRLAGGVLMFVSLILSVLKHLATSPWADLLGKIDAAKSDFIMACYNATNAQTAHDDAIDTLGELSVFESLFVRQCLPVGTFEHLFIEDDYPMPDDPVICASVNVEPVDEWIYGSPHLLAPFGSAGRISSENIAGAYLIECTTTGRYAEVQTYPGNQVVNATFRRTADEEDRTREIICDGGASITFHGDGDNDCVYLQLACDEPFEVYLWLAIPA